MKVLRCVLLCGAPILFASAAHAADVPAAASDHVTIDVSATIAERCGLTSDGQLSSSGNDLDAATSLEFNFKIDCNTRFRIGVSSTNGALRLAESQPALAARTGGGNDGFARDKEYNVELRVNTDGNALTPDVCGSRELTSGGNCAFYGETAGQGLSSGQRTAIDRRGKLTVSWPATGDGGPRRIAGTYSDTITIVVGVRS